MSFHPDLPEAVRRWKEAKAALAEWTLYESQLRDLVTQLAVGEFHEGTQTLDIGPGHRIQATKQVTYSVVGDEDQLQSRIDALAATGPEGQQIADTLLNWKPSVVKAVWDSLDDATKSYLAPFIEARTAKVQVSYTEPGQ